MAVFIFIRPDDTMVRAVLALHLAVTIVGPCGMANQSSRFTPNEQ
jgi:hypothetical protein